MPYETDPPDGQNLARIFIIPPIDKQVIQQAYEGLISDTNNNIVLSNLHSNITFDEASFILFKNYMKKNPAPSKAAVDLTYYFIISWLSPLNQDKLQYYFDFLKYLSNLETIIPQDTETFLINSLTLKYNSFPDNQIPIDVITQFFSKCTKENIYILVDILDKAIQINDAAKYSTILQIINSAIVKEPNSFQSTDFSRFLQIINPLLFQLNPQVLALLSTLPKATKQPELLDCFAEIPPHVFIGLDYDKNFKIEFIPPTFYAFQSYSYEYEYTFHEDIVSFKQRNSFSDFEVSNSLKDFVFPAHQLNVAVLSPILSDIPQQYSTKFFESFAGLVVASKERFDLYIDYLSLLFHPNTTAYTKIIFDAITVAPIFTSETLFFKKGLGIIGVIRDSLINDFIIYHLDCLQVLLHTVRSIPFMYAEILGRILVKIHLVRNFSFVNEEMLVEIVHVLNILLSMLHEQKYEQYFNQIQDARSVIYSFIFAIIEDKETAYRCFKSPDFSISFLSRILDNSLKSLVLEYFQKVLNACTPENADDLSQAARFIGAIFEIAKDPKFIPNITDLLKTLNNSLMLNNNLAQVFRKVIDQVTVFITVNPTLEIIKESLDLILHIHIFIQEYHLTSQQIRRISEAIRSLHDSEPRENLVASVLGMAGRSRSINMSGMFMLQNPELIPLFLSLFTSDESTRKALAYLDNLAKHSTRNTFLMQKGELDLILIESINHYPDEFDFGGLHFKLKYEESAITEVILPLISYLSSLKSSPHAAAKFITLFVPGKEYPKYAIHAMEFATKTLSDLSADPSVYVGCGIQDQDYYISGIVGSTLNEGFTLAFYLKVDVPYAQLINAHPQIVSILDENNAAIKIFLTGSSLIVKILTINGVSSAVLTSTLDSCKWIPIIISQKRINDNTVQFEYSVNFVASQAITVQCPPFTDNTLEIRLGAVFDGQCEDENALSYSTLISDMALYPSYYHLRDESFRGQNIIKHKKFDTKPLFVYPTAGIEKFTLAECLASNAELFHPFFAYIDKTPPHFLDLLIDMMKELCKAGAHFDFGLISYLLKAENNPDCLTYSLWCRFDSLLETITDKKQMKSLISNIVMNADLWHRAQAKELVRIINNWPSLLEFNLFEIIPFRTLLSYMRVYFYHDPVEKEFIKERKPDFDIAACYSSLIKILKAHKMTEMDMAAVVSHCGSCQDTEQVVSLLGVLQNNGKSEFNSIPKLLFYLLKPKKERLFVAALRAIAALSGEHFAHYVEVIIPMMKSFFCTVELFEGLIAVIKEIPLAFPLLIIIAVELKIRSFDTKFVEDTADALLNLRMPPKSITPLWVIWPAILSTHLDQEYFVQNVGFTGNLILDSDSFSFFEESIAHIELLSATRTDENYLDFIADVTKLVIDIKFSHVYDSRLFSLCTKQLLLHRDYQMISQQLKELYDDSPFRPEERMKLSASRNLEKISLSVESFNLGDFVKATPKSPLISNEKLAMVSSTMSHKLLPTINFDQLSLASNYFATYTQEFNIIPQFGYRGQESLLQTTCQIFTALKEVSNVELCIGGYLQKILKHEKIDVALQSSLIELSIHFINQHSNNDSLRSLQNRTRTHWVACDKRSQAYTLLFDTGIASIASGDIDAQLESSYSLVNKTARIWHQLRKSLFNESSAWGKQTPEKIFKKSFRTIGDIEEPLIKRYIPHKFEFDIEPTQGRPCRVIKIDRQIDSQFTMANDTFSIKKEGFTKTYKYTDLKYVLQRAPFHRYTAIELFFNDGRTIFLDFAPIRSLQDIIKKFQSQCPSSTVVQVNNFQTFFHRMGITEKWLRDEITNFEYLMYLNIFGGRSFRHPALYPIFPWVVLDFISDTVYDDQKRDLQWPISAQTPLQRKTLGQKLEDSNFLYFSAPSNPTIVAHWLVRVEPFTTLHLDNEGGKFDVQSRMFNSLSGLTVQVLESSCSWECVPEFYDTPEFLYDLNKRNIGDVVCPPWGPEPFQFICGQRKILESEYVTNNLNLWIDMIFGYAQKDNKVRKQRLNSFNEILTEEVWKTEEQDFDEDVIEITLNKSGHLPSTLFKDPHPVKTLPPIPKNLLTQPVLTMLENKPPIEKATVVNFDYPTITFCVVYNNGQSETLVVDLESNKNNIKTINLPKIEQNSEKTPYVNGFIVSGNKYIKLFNHNGSETNNITPDHPILFDTTVKPLVYVCRDASIRSISGDIKIRTALTDRIVCLTSSERYKIVVVCTTSSRLVVYRYDGSFMYDIFLGNVVPEKVMISSITGTIIVYSSSMISLYTVNGFKIIDVKVPYRVSCWTSYFDFYCSEYLVCVDQSGNIYVSPLSDLKLDKASYIFSGAYPVSIAYNKGIICVLGQLGKVFAVPIDH